MRLMHFFAAFRFGFCHTAIMRPIICLSILFAFSAQAATLQDAGLQTYFTAEVEKLEQQSLTNITSLEEWKELRPKLREQLYEMLSLSPLPEKTDLKPVITGRTEHEDFVVEKLHFQSMPGLYVTGNLYLPKQINGPLPTILYVCGHGAVKQGGISYGNKVTYQHHGAWFARNGYAALLIDTVQLGEIEGIHHGTYREGMWWWNSRGYSSAGVEAWNCIRALDYLETRPEVDKTKFGVTGRSGGGAYSWWVTTLDERIKVSAPVAGITDLRNHVIDGVVEGHCDCMYMVNTYRWDYAKVAALTAPRPLLIANSDKDTIFPLDGVVRLHAQVAHIYKLHNASDKLGLLITEGPHKDTQDLQVPVFRWFNRWLKNSDEPIEMAAQKFFSPQDLRVFSELPNEERTSHIHDTFVPIAKTLVEKPARRGKLVDELKQKAFRGWPESTVPLNPERETTDSQDGLTITKIWFDSQEHVRLPIYIAVPANLDPDGRVYFHVLDGPVEQKLASLRREVASELPGIQVLFAPRGIGENAWQGDAKKQIQIRRRFMLVGQTADAMRVWDITRALELLSELPETTGLPRFATASGHMAVNLAYAALLSRHSVEALRLEDLPSGHMQGPDYLNVLRITDLPEVLQVLKDSGLKILP